MAAISQNMVILQTFSLQNLFIRAAIFKNQHFLKNWNHSKVSMKGLFIEVEINFDNYLKQGSITHYQ
jgi:hypothetical protein